jgi:hypothetical protein
MTKVCVLQTDNRPSLNYLQLTMEANKRICDILGYEYMFIELKNDFYGNFHPATKKIHVVNDLLGTPNWDCIVFLDSDAWIQDGFCLKIIIDNLMNNEKKHGCFSRDQYQDNVHCTFINSGSFIIKNNDFIKQMYEQLVFKLYNTNNHFQFHWPYDQFYISNYIFENKDFFTIFVPEILNCPYGEVLRHNWWKSNAMYDDLNALKCLKKEELYKEKNFNETNFYDTMGEYVKWSHIGYACKGFPG